MDLPESIKNPLMTLITKSQMKKLRANFSKSKTGGKTGRPLIKITGYQLTWLVAEIDPIGNVYAFSNISEGADTDEKVEYCVVCNLDELPHLMTEDGYLERDPTFKDNPNVNYFDLDSLD